MLDVEHDLQDAGELPAGEGLEHWLYRERYLTGAQPQPLTRIAARLTELAKPGRFGPNGMGTATVLLWLRRLGIHSDAEQTITVQPPPEPPRTSESHGKPDLAVASA